MNMPPFELLEPLVRFRSEAGAEFEAVSQEQIPEPARTLLVHQGDMTSRLQRFHQSEIGLRVLQSRREGDDVYSREVLLLAQASGAPVEYGAIEIFLGGLSSDLRTVILEGKVPLGGILNSSGMQYRSEPQEFFRLRQSPALASLLGAQAGIPLYGRCNVLRTVDGTLLARIVEVLPNGSLAPAVQPVSLLSGKDESISAGG
jgi:chorismate-pyruvate lyase